MVEAKYFIDLCLSIPRIVVYDKKQQTKQNKNKNKTKQSKAKQMINSTNKHKQINKQTEKQVNRIRTHSNNSK